MADNKVNFLRGTSAEYEASTKDNDAFYYTTDDGKLYLGNKEITNGGVTIDDTLSDTSKNPVQNKVINAALNNKAELTDIPDKLPADGGNADTVDGKHAVDFLPNKAECVNGANYDDFAVSGFYEVLGNADNPTQNSPTGDETNNNFYLIVQRRSNQYCSQIAVSVRTDKSVYIRNKSNNIWGSWTKVADGGNAATVNGHTVNANVPANAVFTDTTYNTVSQTKDGLMSAADKKKLDGIAAGANKYTLPTASSSTLGGVKTSSTVTSSSGYTACPIISGVPYYKDTNTTYSTATSSANGLMSSSDKKKLDGIYSEATPVTIRTGIVPKYGATNDTISLSYLSGRTKALVMIYKDGTISSLNYSAFSSLHLAGISNSMTASSSSINTGANTGCEVAISTKGVITLKPTPGATASQRYIVIYYN